MAKSALETKIKDIERDLKKETHEANQIRAKLEQDLSKLKEVEYNLKKDAEEAKENCTKIEQDLLRKTESFDQLIWSWAELEKFKEEEKNQSKYDEQFEMGKRDKGLFVYVLCET